MADTLTTLAKMQEYCFLPGKEMHVCVLEETVQIFCARAQWQGNGRHRHLRIDPTTQEVWYIASAIYCAPTKYQAVG